MLARIKAILRRFGRQDGRGRDATIKLGPLELDAEGYTVSRDGELLDLTPTEFKILALLIRRPGQAFTRSQISEAVSTSQHYLASRYIDVHISRLRGKVERDPSKPELVQTVPSVGYRAARPVVAGTSRAPRRSKTVEKRGNTKNRFLAPSFRVRIFMALVGISSVTSLVIGVVLYYFAQERLSHVESDLLAQRSRTANAGAKDFLEGLRSPEDQTLPTPDTYAKKLVRSVSDPTGLGVLYVGPNGKPLAARDGLGNTLNPQQVYERRGMSAGAVRQTMESADREGRLKYVGDQRYVAVWPLTGADGQTRGVLVYSSSNEELQNTLAYLRYGILGAILTSIILAGLASLLLTRQITRPLSQTRDAAIRVASGDYATTVPVTSGDELGEVARAFNYMAEEIEHYVRADPGAEIPSGGRPRRFARGRHSYRPAGARDAYEPGRRPDARHPSFGQWAGRSRSLGLLRRSSSACARRRRLPLPFGSSNPAIRPTGPTLPG